ncbi:WD_REPEATS_REGION domain-containing protein, partial [Haematococcus lacustris]
VTGLVISDRHPYLFSCGLDKTVKCWDLEQNKVIRSYHGHLSGVYSIALHPKLDVLMTGGRDSVCRVWDVRTKVQVHCLSGHEQTVCSILAQPTDPQVITGSHDSTIKLWDLRSAKAFSTLTFHKKSVRAMAAHPEEHAFASASADNIKKFALPNGDFLHNTLTQQKSIVNTMAINHENVMVTGADSGGLWWWDWTSGHCFQQEESLVQPGSLEAEKGIYACTFDHSGSRLITCEADKTVKMWKEDADATPASHPGLPYKPPKDIRRF